MRRLLPLTWGLVILVGSAGSVYGQRKPVTLEALHEWQSRPRESPGSAVWAPDGRSFAHQTGSKLMLYSVAAGSERELASLDEMDSLAVKSPEPERYDWENRRVNASPLQWSPSGRELLYESGGDLFRIDAANGTFKQLTKTSEPEHDPKIAPDGVHVAFRRGWDLYALDMNSGKEIRLTGNGTETLRNGGLDWVYPEELDLGTAYWWSPDSKSIAYLQFDVSAESVYPHEDLRGVRPIYEPQRYPQAGTNNASIKLGVVAATGGSTTWINIGDTVNAWLVARAGWTPDSKSVYVARLNRVQNRLEFDLFSAENGKSSPVFRESDRYWINLDGDPVFLRSRPGFLWTSERDGFRHLYLYSNHEGEPKQLTPLQLTKGAWEVTDIACVDEIHQRVYFVSSQASPLERQLYSVGFDGSGQRQISRGAGNHTISMAPGCGSYLDRYSNHSTPPEITLHSSDGSQLAVYRAADRSVLDEFEILPTELVSFKGKDGIVFHARLIKPAGFDPSKKYPAVVSVYGGPGIQAVRDYWTGLNTDQVYARQGYVVWEMDNRGSAGRGHAFETPVYHNLGAVEAADQRAGIEYLVSLGFVDPERIGVNGWSYGGFMTIHLLLHQPDLFRAGFAGAPVTNWMNYDTIYTERYMGLPKDNPEGYERTALPQDAANLRARLMIAHNVEDDNVMFQNTVQMITALENQGKEFGLALYPQKTHGVSGAAAQQLDATMLDFFERWLKPPR